MTADFFSVDMISLLQDKDIKKREPLKATLRLQKIKTLVPGTCGCGGSLCRQVVGIGADFMQSADSVKGLIFRCQCHFLRFEDNLFLANEFLLHLPDDQTQVTRMRHVIQVIGGDGEDGAKGEILYPRFIQLI